MATSFQATWRKGRPVQEVASPHRTGTIRTVRGTGTNAVVIVNLKGHPPQGFRPAQLTPL